MKIHRLSSALLAGLLLAVSCPCSAGEPLPKTPVALHLDPEGRDVYRQGFLAGREDQRAHLSADHRRHSFPPAFEDVFRCGYITGLTYGWFAFGVEKRVRKEYPEYLEDYLKQQVHR